MIPLVITSIVGGLAGAFLLIKHRRKRSLRVLPCCSSERRCSSRLQTPHWTDLCGYLSRRNQRSRDGASVFELLVAVYGGYFGGGIGIMNLAMLAAMG